MTEKLNFDQVIKTHLETLAQYVPIVDRVHGEHHPEFHQVREVYEKIAQKVKDSQTGRPDLAQEFKQLREITDQYTVPGDVCESYEAVYKWLEEIDEAYESKK